MTEAPSDDPRRVPRPAGSPAEPGSAETPGAPRRAAGSVDSGAFQRLVRPHVESLHALASRLLGGDGAAADEVVQDALVRAWRGFDGLREPEAVRSWLLRITWNAAKSSRRGAGRAVGGGSGFDSSGVHGAGQGRGARPDGRADSGTEQLPHEVPAGLSADPLGPVRERELEQRLRAALERLPERQRAALHLRTWEGLDYAAIGTALECSSGAARMLVLEARRRLRERLGGELEP